MGSHMDGAGGDRGVGDGWRGQLQDWVTPTSIARALWLKSSLTNRADQAETRRFSDGAAASS
jgi:hypothetical protein